MMAFLISERRTTILTAIHGEQHICADDNLLSDSLFINFVKIYKIEGSILKQLHTKHWFALNLSMQLLFGIPIAKVEKVQKTAARWTCRRWRNSSSVGDMLDELEWPSLQSRRERSSLTFLYKIHSGTVSLGKDKYLTPAPNLRRTRTSHESQYTRQFAYSDALSSKNKGTDQLLGFS